MDLDAALTILRRPGTLGPPSAQDVADALAAAGVLAARNADPGRLADLPADPGTDVAGAQPALRWADPGPWLAVAGPAVENLSRWWRTRHRVDGIRLTLPVGPEVPVAAIQELRSASRVAAVAVDAPLPHRNEVPAWTWPLRLSVGDRWPTDPLRPAGRPPSWWRTHVVPVDTTGPWAIASLALLEPAARPLPDAEPVRATAVVLPGDPTAPPPADDLTGLAERHRAAIVAVVDPGPDRAAWLIRLIEELTHDRTLDAALFAAAAGRPAPVVLGDTRALAGLRLRPLILHGLRRIPSDAPPRRQVRGRDLRESYENGLFLSELGPAYEAAQALRTEQVALQGAVERFLRAELADAAGVPAVVAPDTDYRLRVSIGHDEQARARGASPFSPGGRARPRGHPGHRADRAVQRPESAGGAAQCPLYRAACGCPTTATASRWSCRSAPVPTAPRSDCS